MEPIASRSQKHAWTWRIKPEHLDEYVRMHRDPWPEILQEHTRAGIRNYSIFQNGCQFFYCLECDDIGHALAYLAASEACQRWNAITSQMVESGFDLGEDNALPFLPEVFFLA